MPISTIATIYPSYFPFPKLNVTGTPYFFRSLLTFQISPITELLILFEITMKTFFKAVHSFFQNDVLYFDNLELHRKIVPDENLAKKQG